MRLATALILIAALAIPAVTPAVGAGRHRPRHGAAAARARVARHAAPASAGTWGTTVYGASLPSIDGSCTDPYDPDPIGGPDGVGDGGPGAFLGRCNGPGRVPGGAR